MITDDPGEDFQLAIDANVFINAATKAESPAFKLLEKIKNGAILATTSVLTIDEVMWVINKLLGHDAAVRAAEAMIIFPNLELIDATPEIMSLAVTIFQKGRLKPRDAIHLATMQSRNITSIATEDSDFDKIKGIKRVQI